MNNVLVFPAGSSIALEIWSALKDCKDINLIGATSVINDHTPYLFKNYYQLPSVYDSSWPNELKNLVEEKKIDFIFPAHDDVVLALANNLDLFKDKAIIPSKSTCGITRSKKSTYKFLNDLIPTPKIFSDAKEINSFPVFVKPDKGQGSRNCCIINNLSELNEAISKVPEPLILEYLPGEEYTIDCFSDNNKGLMFAGARQRIMIDRGISMSSKPVSAHLNNSFIEYAKLISNKLLMRGSWFFQMKKDSSGNLKLLEVAPRISGTMATYRVQGINFPLLSIYEKTGKKLQLMINPYSVEINRVLANRYKHSLDYNTVYVDLDDTLVLHGKVNPKLMSFLYQSVNSGCKLILITKSLGNVNEMLKKYKLISIFDEIIHLTKDQQKSDFINPNKSIFIDDSFTERKEVYAKTNIPTFDLSMIELLIDDSA